MTITYGPRVNVHPDRYGSVRTSIHYLILHTSEQSGAEDDHDAEDLARYLESPGDRPSSSGGFYGSSYHGITDTDRVLPCVPDDRVAYAAGGGNRYGLHLCLPVKAGQTRAEWLDATSRPYIEQAARWIVDKSERYGIPIRRIGAAQMAAGSWGYADHWAVSQAFGRSSHTDLGRNFPWDVLAADIARVLDETAPPTPPPSEDDMSHKFVKPKGYKDQFLLIPMSAETKRRIGDVDAPFHEFIVDDVQAFEDYLGYGSLTPE